MLVISICLRPVSRLSPADAHDARFACVLWERAVWLMLVMLDLLAACQGSARLMLMMLALLASYGKGQS